MPEPHENKPVHHWEATRAHPGHSYYEILLGASAVVLILSNIGATKGVALGPILTDGGFFLFPLAYVIGDVLSEVYGFARTRRVIIFSFCAAIAASLTFWMIIKLPPADYYQNQPALEAVLGPVPLVVGGSLLGYLVGQLLNSWVMVTMKATLHGRFLPGRLMGSTLVGELADTIIFCTVAAPIVGISTPGDYLNYVLIGYLYKCAVELLLMPVTIPVIGWFTRSEKATTDAGSNKPTPTG